MNGTVSAPGFWRNPIDYKMERMTHPWFKHLVQLENTISCETMMFYRERGLLTMHLPITTGSISSPMGRGSDSSPVRIEMFGVDTYLADSMQFMLEYGCRLHPKGCYYLMPSFRGEQADVRHLCQFYHSEAEIPGTLEDVMNLVEEYLRHLCQKILQYNREDILAVAGDTNHISNFLERREIPRLTMDEAIAILSKVDTQETLYRTDEEFGFRTITSAGEKYLMAACGGIVWITHFDHLSVPFYQAFDKTGMYAKNADLLFGIGEVVGAGERHETAQETRQALDLHLVKEDEYQWYLTMKDIAPMKTSGFGLGIERFMLWLLKHDDIRDCQVLSRFNGVECMP